MRRFMSVLPALTVGLFVAACGSDSPTDPGGNNNGNEPPVREIKANPSFANDIIEIFNRRGCTAGNCHGGGAGGLTMTGASDAYTNLVGVPSTGTGEVLVIANDAANSYLVKKLEGTQGAGARMPLGGSPLDNIDLTNVKNWINTGAPNN